MSDFALDLFHSLRPEDVDGIYARSPPMRHLIDRNWRSMPRWVVDRVVIKKRRGRFQLSISRTDRPTIEKKDVPFNEDFARICNRFKPRELTFKGDSMIPRVDFNWVNSTDIVLFRGGENRQNINMFLERYTKSYMDFHSIIPVTADEVLRSMTSLTSFRYFCGPEGMETGIVSKETLRLIAEKSNLGSGILQIFIYNRMDDDIIEPQDVTEFLRSAKFEDREVHVDGECTPFVFINHVSATPEEFDNHLGAENFVFRILENNDYQIQFADKTVYFCCNF